MAKKVLELLDGGYQMFNEGAPGQEQGIGLGVVMPLTGSPDNNAFFMRHLFIRKKLSNGNGKRG